MSEKPFYITDTGLGLDTESDEMYSFGDEEDFCRLFDKLNEQQATISQLKEENVQLQKEKINMKYAEQIVEENQQLRIAKNDLRREKEQLQKKNEQLRKELDNFKPVMFQDMRKGTVILYTKKFDNNDEVLDYKEAIIQVLKLENENLRKENKRLKERNDELEDELEESSAFIIEQRKENKTLKEENEQLKKENKRLKERNDELEESSAFIIEQREELSKIFPNEQRINQGETIIQSKDGIGERVL